MAKSTMGSAYTLVGQTRQIVPEDLGAITRRMDVFGQQKKAITFIINLAPTDPLTDLQIQNNRKPPKDDHGDHPSPSPKPPKPPKLIPRAGDDDGGNDD